MYPCIHDVNFVLFENSVQMCTGCSTQHVVYDIYETNTRSTVHGKLVLDDGRHLLLCVDGLRVTVPYEDF